MLEINTYFEPDNVEEVETGFNPVDTDVIVEDSKVEEKVEVEAVFEDIEDTPDTDLPLNNTIKFISYRLLKKFNKRYEWYKLNWLYETIKSKDSWALQYLANIVGRKFFKGSPLEITQKGLEIIELLPKSVGEIRIGDSPYSDVYTGAFIVKEPEYKKEEWTTIEPVDVTQNIIEYKDKRDWCHKEFWRGNEDELPTDAAWILNDVIFTLDERVNNVTDFSYDDIKDSSKKLDFNAINREKAASKILRDKWLGRSFSFKHFFDTRGRIYSEGYHINPQGTKYKKANLTMINNEFELDGLELIKDKLQ